MTETIMYVRGEDGRSETMHLFSKEPGTARLHCWHCRRWTTCYLSCISEERGKIYRCLECHQTVIESEEVKP